MLFSKRKKYFLLCLLILLNFLIRIPSIPHERGSGDEFTMHSLANSLSTFGHANWWVHPASIFGFYPYSYASATAFVFSGISQSTGISLELTAWILSAILGIFVMFSAYLLAGQVKNDDVFRFLTSFLISLSPGTLNYLTWQVSARGFFVALLPFFIYLLLRNRTFAVRFGVLGTIFFILLTATHHYYILTIPFIFGYIIVRIYYKIRGFFRLQDTLISIALLAGFLGMFSIPFFTGIFIQSSRYGALQYILENNIRYSGPIIFFAFGGASYLIFKSNREFGEWLLLLSLIFLAPFLYIDRYAQFISAALLSLLTAIGLINTVKIPGVNKKYTFSIIVIALMIFVSFSAFYQHWRTGDIQVYKWYMEDTTYNGALWIKENMENGRLVGNDDMTSTRVLATSGVPTLVMPETDITYGFINASNINNVSMNSPFSVEFYMGNPYKLPTPYHETDSSRWYLENLKVDSVSANYIISRFNLSFYIDDTDIGEGEVFIRSLEGKKEQIYNNGKIRIWCLECSS